MARILIAEDDSHIARVMSIWLARHGHQTTCVATGVQALAHMESNPVDLVISDMNMPELDGLGLVKAIRARKEPAVAATPIIILSARCDQQELTEVLSSYGVRLYPKPFLPSYLVMEIHRCLEVTGEVAAGRNSA